MPKITVCFAHGRESGPWGIKIRAMARVAESLGCRVVSRDDSDTRDPDLRVSRLIEESRAIVGPVILVGSSMGGYVATVASAVIQPLLPGLIKARFGFNVSQIRTGTGFGVSLTPELFSLYDTG